MNNKVWNVVKTILESLLASYIILSLLVISPMKIMDRYFDYRKDQIEKEFITKYKLPPSIFDKPFQFEGTPPSAKPYRQYQMKEGMYVSKYDHSIIMEIEMNDPIYQDCDEYLSLLRAKTAFEERLKDFK